MNQVQLLAFSTLTPDAMDIIQREGNEYVPEADLLAEIAGTECYQSQHKPNPATAFNADYVKNILVQQHYSVLAHASFTFRFVDVSRALTHELIRHRFLAFSELSQRYVDMSDSYTIVPPLFRDEEVPCLIITDAEKHAAQAYEELVNYAVNVKGATRKQARQAARYVIAGGTQTRIVVSGNVRAWRDFILQRNSPHADAEIREIAQKVLDYLRVYAPSSVSDL